MSTPGNLNTLPSCGCCETKPEAQAHTNPPGLPELKYRVGTYGSFMARMKARIYRWEIPNGPFSGTRPLAELSTRSPDDPALAWMDAWAVAADVLTFYQERIANEGFLRTSTERGSILQLARAVGYELDPGVAASTYLAFTVEDAPGAPGVVNVPKGTGVQSVPVPPKLPQTFETDEEIEARVEWNALKPRPTVPQDIDRGLTELYLKGTDTGLKSGDAILLVGDTRETTPGSERWDFRLLQTVELHPEENQTRVTWQEALGHEKPTTNPADNPQVFAFRRRVAVFGHNAPDWRSMSDDIKAGYGGANWENLKQWPNFKIGAGKEVYLDAAYSEILEDSWVALVKPGYVELYKAVRVAVDSRTDFALTAQCTRIELDTDEHLSWFGLRDTVVFVQSDVLTLAEKPLRTPVFGRSIACEKQASPLQKAQPLVISGKPVTSLTVSPRVRVVKRAKTEVLREEPLYLLAADGSKSEKLSQGDRLRVVTTPTRKPSGRIRWHVKTSQGKVGFVDADADDLLPDPPSKELKAVSEIAFVEEIQQGADVTGVLLKDPLSGAYERTTVTICANVAPASHGETVPGEVLGSGDGSAAHQRFTLRKKPLTYVSAATPQGSQSTLSVRVDGIEWTEAPSLFGLTGTNKNYIVRIDNDAKASIVFGDGKKGARLPTGQENVVATYRSGIGTEGEVDANSLTMLKTRPFGIRSVANPFKAGGADDPEKLEDARVNAPLKVLTLDRIVSLQDYENFARAFPGIGKAQATVVWDGESEVVHLTVADANGGEVVYPLHENLLKAIEGARDPFCKMVLASYESLVFVLKASVLKDEAYLWPTVKGDIEKALLDAFSFARREFGQAVTAAEVLHVMHTIKGVKAVDLDELYHKVPSAAAPVGDLLNSVLPARPARYEKAQERILAAQLLLVDKKGIHLTESHS
jgi:hypothetical protein